MLQSRREYHARASLRLSVAPSVLFAHYCCCSVLQGLDEVSIATIMKFVLQGLEYVHKNGGIHRDVKVCDVSHAALCCGRS
jgi:serine/threonine protein kinase